MKQVKQFLGILFIMSMMISCVTDNNYRSDVSMFNDGWRFFKVDSSMQIDEKQITQGLFPSQTLEVRLPHTPCIEPLVVNDQWQGICYYAKSFLLEEKDAKQNIFLKFEGAMNTAEIWLNGVYMNKHIGGYLPFTIDISKSIRTDSLNMIVVRLDNRDNPTTGPKPLKELDFNTYGGIYRNVWLIKKAPVYISDPVYANRKGSGGIIVKTKDISKRSATVTIGTHIINSTTESKNITIEHSIYLKNGNQVLKGMTKSIIEANSDKKIDYTSKVDNPSLWSPDTPNLYLLETKLYVDDTLADQETNQIGIRDINISEKGLYLNGVKTFLRGVNRHQEYPYIGYALSDEAQYRDAYKIKAAGFDYVRASHYPPSSAFLKACDELGIFVLDAILGWQYFGDSSFIEHSKKSARELIRRDRNHPCILAWELSINETPMPKEFMKEMNQIRAEEAPDTYTAGWIKGDYDIYIEARQHRKDIDLTVPFMVSEYGDWEYYAQNAGFNQGKWNDLLTEERSSRQPRESGEKRMLQQVQNIQEAHNDNLSTNAFADGYWAMFDYNRGYANDLEYSGIMDICRLPKFSYYLFQSQRSVMENNQFAKAMVHIASYWKPGISKYVKVFSNCDEVELYLNDYFVSRKRPDNDYSALNLNHPPFTFDISCIAPGILKAYGYYNGVKVCSDSIQTPGRAAKISMWADTCGISPRTNDLVFIHAKIEDEKGTLVDDATEIINFHLKGDGIIVNNKTVETAGGIASILLKTGNKSGEITIEAEHPQLKKGTIRLVF